VSTFDDLGRIIRQAEYTTGSKIARITLHPEDYNELRRDQRTFFAKDPQKFLGECQLYADARQEKGVAYVVTVLSESERAIRGASNAGILYRLTEPPPPRTAWARLLADEELV
jgi:hypothetical protein